MRRRNSPQEQVELICTKVQQGCFADIVVGFGTVIQASVGVDESIFTEVPTRSLLSNARSVTAKLNPTSPNLCPVTMYIIDSGLYLRGRANDQRGRPRPQRSPQEGFLLRTQTEVKPTRWQTGGLEGAALRSLDLAFERQEDKVESLHATNPIAVSTSNKKNSRSAKVSECASLV